MPYQQEPRKVNAIQQQRSSVTNEQLQSDRDNLMSAGQLPRGLIRYTQKFFESEGHINKLAFNVQTQKYRLESKSKTDENDVSVFEGTLEGIAQMQEMELAELQRKANEIEEAEFRKNPKFEDPESQECWKWLQTVHGQEYNTIKCETAWDRMLEEMDRLCFKRITVEALEQAYCHIVDREERNFDWFFGKRDRLAAERAKEEAAAKAAQQVEETPALRSPTPFANITAARDVRSTDEARAARQMDIGELRQKAVPARGGKSVERIPSTGTGIRY
jgi:hypothetical protein